MFPYDAQLAAATGAPPRSIPDVLEVMQAIDNLCIEGDGLKWFNWLYHRVTQAVADRINSGTFKDPAWMADLDVRFARLYFDALHAALTGAPHPGCWEAMFSCRGRDRITRIQFALAGMNAHINHDLAMAIVATCKATNTAPQHGSAHYDDYTDLNSTLCSLIDTAKQTLNVLPVVPHLEDLIAGWDLAAAREQAWNTAGILRQVPALVADIQMGTIDGFTTVIGKALLVPIP